MVRTMAVRTDGVVTLPAFLLRVFMAPVAFGALIATVTGLLRRRTRQPTMPQMGDEWLRNHPVAYRDDLPW